MITRIKIDGFKSFSDFEVELKPFNVIVGANGSGKSNLLDALKLLRNLTEGSIAEAFSKQRGTPSELFTRYPDGSTAQEMSFEVDVFYVNYYDKDKKNQFRISYAFTIGWATKNGVEKLVLKKESIAAIAPETDHWVLHNIPSDQRALWLNNFYQKPSSLTFDGSTFYDELVIKRGGYYSLDEEASFKVLNFEILPMMFGTAIKQLKFLDLNPQKLRLPSSKYGAETLQEDGSNLAATLNRVVKNNPEYLGYISTALSNLLPAYKEVKVVHDNIQEMYYITVQNNNDTWFNARLLSEGTLRILALVVLQFDDKHKGTLCLEEPENGVHPFRIKAVLELLQELCTDLSSPPEDGTQLKQTILTTHSPVLLSKALELEGNIALFYSDIVTSVSPKRSFPMKATRLYPIYQEKDTPSKITLNIGEKKIYAKQVIDYLHSADLEH